MALGLPGTMVEKIILEGLTCQDPEDGSTTLQQSRYLLYIMLKCASADRLARSLDYGSAGAV